MKIRRALLTVSDKSGLTDLGLALSRAGAEIVATGKTAQVLKEAGIRVVPIEEVSGSPEAFQGRMKTLSFPVCSGILARRRDPSDERDLERLRIRPIDCVVVNFYPFENAASKEGISREQLIEEVDIGGPTLVRAAAKNAPDVLVLTSPGQYQQVIKELAERGEVSSGTAHKCAEAAWERILQYDSAIARELGGRGKLSLRYGENPHQRGLLEFDANGPIAWPGAGEPPLTASELSYNNILDVSAAYALASDLIEIGGNQSTGVVIVKHNNPCGVALVPTHGNVAEAQKLALQKAWDGDPVSAFGGVLVFTHALEAPASEWLAERFVELVAAPGLTPGTGALYTLLAKRKNLKAVRIRRFGEFPTESVVAVPGGKLFQSTDLGLSESLKSVTRSEFPAGREKLAKFGIAVCRALKSNAIAIVRELPETPGALQLVGAGQGQPNRVEALEKLAVPRAREVLGGELDQCLMVSDAFFPFRDTVDRAHKAGLKYIIQPGGSIKDAESIQACNEHGIAMAFTGVRHFRH
jgi:phosphoribosylaminoimidazolecarboxamide formyltransferase/IMP cyclohydrolase